MIDDVFKKYNWSGKKILIVEDDISSSFFLKEVLEETGVALEFATDGITALNMCKDDLTISLVLMDIQIPFLNGFETTIQIKEIRPDLPVIAQTAYAFIDDREKSLQIGCDDYISKPIDPFELLDRLSLYMGGR
jgi:two-component system, cell cycle response regulator DivK